MKKVLLSCFLSLGLGASAQTYCTPSYSDGCDDGDQINSFSIPAAGFSHVNTGCSAGQYGDFHSTHTINLSASVAYNFTVTHDYGYQTVRVWADFNNDGSFDSSELIGSGASPQTGASTQTSSTVTVPASTPLGNYRLRIATKYDYDGTEPPEPCDNTDGFGEVHDYTLAVTVPPSCVAPSALNTTTVSSSGLQVTWTAPATAPANGYDIYYSATNTPPVAATVPSSNAASSPAALSSLAPATTYYVWVRSRCSTADQSVWVAAGSAATSCAPLAAPFYESFSSGTLPNCWTNINPTTTSTSTNAFWKFSGNPEYGASPVNNGRTAGTFAWVDASSPYTGEHQVQLTTPEINLTGLTNPYVQFEWYKNHLTSATGTLPPYDNNKLTVHVTSDGTTWNQIFTNDTNASNWRLEGIPLGAAYAGATIRVRFTVDKDAAGNGYFYDDLLLDEVRVMETPTCLQPTGVAVSNVTSFSADFVWNATAPVPGNGYDFYYSTSNTPPTAATVPTAAGLATPAYSLTGLLPSTLYYVWVRSNCSSSTQSLWSAGPSFTTISFCPVVTAPANGVTGASLTPTITWNAMPGATSYIITMGSTSGGTDILNAVNVGNVTTYTLTAPLANSTTYYYTVNASNGTVLSQSCAVRSFTTVCASILPNYTNNFNTFPGSCWSVASGGSPATGPTGTGSGISFNWRAMVFLTGTTGAGATSINLYSSGRAGWLISPVFNLSAGGTKTLTFDYGITEYGSANPSPMGSDDVINVLMSTDGGATWTTIQTWTAADNIDNSSHPYSYTIPAASATSQVMFAFYGTDGTVSDGEDFEFYVDNFMITDSSLSTSEIITDSKEVRVYPNPFTDVLNITDAQNLKSVSVVDMSGRLVKTIANPGRQINLSELKAGLYILKLDYKDGTSKSVKAIKK
ncbi:fibronectin type III domain-containing protein [Marnyiella aurantia]|uniref:Fibronectin type III domain-containing protein n=1 Tax=Marnyiella aurantia TaxID=2758037 RepID=A0A7D7QLF3_9FLAO|nr:GEVED domain-containing protein [Marnyiella aurantia]MBA5247325.1 fibronectin type III domain-containing protein [Marnyiella aurantia]QMS99085.1 fibronectin type III domain-containing protein [Marnyiella aurantia]